VGPGSWYGGPQVTTFAQSSHSTTTPERLHNDSTTTPQPLHNSFLVVVWLWSHTTTTPHRLHYDSTTTPQPHHNHSTTEKGLWSGCDVVVEWLCCDLIGRRLSLVGHRILALNSTLMHFPLFSDALLRAWLRRMLPVKMHRRSGNIAFQNEQPLNL